MGLYLGSQKINNLGNLGAGGITPTGEKQITSLSSTDVSEYATARVVDQNLIAENIKKNINILGITGTYEGGSSAFAGYEVDENGNAIYSTTIPERVFDNIKNI